MPYDPQLHHRRSIRLPGYDYTQPGAYFVTIATQGRVPLFDNLLFHRVAETIWKQLPAHFPRLTLDCFVIMPEHLHGILIFNDVEDHAYAEQTAGTRDPVSGRPAGGTPGSVGAIVGTYKSLSARRLNAMRKRPGEAGWQRNYFEHVIRSKEAQRRIREYILENPAALECDDMW